MLMGWAVALTVYPNPKETKFPPHRCFPELETGLRYLGLFHQKSFDYADLSLVIPLIPLVDLLRYHLLESKADPHMNPVTLPSEVGHELQPPKDLQMIDVKDDKLELYLQLIPLLSHTFRSLVILSNESLEHGPHIRGVGQYLPTLQMIIQGLIPREFPMVIALE
jgi:hypothetical protein